MAKRIGPTFGDDLRAAGLADGVVWDDNGVISWPPDKLAQVQAVLAAHNPAKAEPLSPRDRFNKLTDAQLNALMALIGA